LQEVKVFLRVLLLQTFPVAATTPAPQPVRRRPAIDPNVAKTLVIVTLGQSRLQFVGFCLNSYISEVREFKNVLELLASRQGYWEVEKGYTCDSPSREGRLAVIFLTLTTSKMISSEEVLLGKYLITTFKVLSALMQKVHKGRPFL
jgi:hypothetical protein